MKNVLTGNYDFSEHEKRHTNKSVRKISPCAFCIRSELYSYETIDRWGRKISKGYSKCTGNC